LETQGVSTIQICQNEETRRIFGIY
jgi:hypothetical protein